MRGKKREEFYAIQVEFMSQNVVYNLERASESEGGKIKSKRRNFPSSVANEALEGLAPLKDVYAIRL